LRMRRNVNRNVSNAGEM